MTWVRFDDMFPIHRKVAPLDDATFRLAVDAVFWCSRNLTDGRIASDELTAVSTKASKARAGRLVARNLWHPANYICPSAKCPGTVSDGWVVHDYFEYQPTKAKVIAEQEAKAERQRKWLEKRKARDASQDKPPDASRDASQDGPDERLKTVPRPRPRPEGKRGRDDPEAADAALAADGPAATTDDDQAFGGGSWCSTCGNATDSSYHRRVCRPEARTA